MPLPLQGLRVIDLTQDFAGPFCTMMLSDLGAEVVKIEKPDGGDETRAWGPPWINGTSYYFHALNRGKKSVVLDLKKPEDQKKIRKMVVDADIFVESSRPGRMKHFQLDYTVLIPSSTRKSSREIFLSRAETLAAGPVGNKRLWLSSILAWQRLWLRVLPEYSTGIVSP